MLYPGVIAIRAIWFGLFLEDTQDYRQSNDRLTAAQSPVILYNFSPIAAERKVFKIPQVSFLRC